MIGNYNDDQNELQKARAGIAPPPPLFFKVHAVFSGNWKLEFYKIYFIFQFFFYRAIKYIWTISVAVHTVKNESPCTLFCLWWYNIDLVFCNHTIGFERFRPRHCYWRGWRVERSKIGNAGWHYKNDQNNSLNMDFICSTQSVKK